MRKLEEGAQSYLNHGERTEVIQPVRNKGSLDAAAMGGAIGAITGARGSRTEREAAADAGVQLGSFMALAITGRRLLLFSVGGVAKVTGLLSQVPLEEVDSIEVSKVMLGARKRIAISTRGGSFVLETPGRQKAEELARAFESARGTLAAS
jgi:hypothetical protein